jgi:hypothetical protein
MKYGKLIFIAFFLPSCFFFPQESSDPQGPSTAEETPVIDFTPNPPTVVGTDSEVVITGNIGGEAISQTWDFSLRGGGPRTNGSVSGQIVSGKPAVSFTFDNDYDIQGDSDWLVRFTFGSTQQATTLYNAKTDFPIPDRGYTMITVRKGPGGTEYRHTQHDSNNEMTGKISTFDYDENTNILRLEGGLRATWDANYVNIDFSVLIGGPDDRYNSTNQSTNQNAYE